MAPNDDKALFEPGRRWGELPVWAWAIVGGVVVAFACGWVGVVGMVMCGGSNPPGLAERR